MTHLSKFTPAELFFLLRKERRRYLKELLKVTFLDLLLKQILVITEVEKEVGRTTQIYRYVEDGRRFFGYRPLDHEAIFIDPFRKDNDIRILFQSMVKIGFQNAKNFSHYKAIIINRLISTGHISQNIFQQIFGLYSLTNQGLDIESKIRTEIHQLEKELPTLIKSTDERATEILKTINGNVFLIDNIRMDLIDYINKAFLATTKEDKQDGDYGFACSHYYGFSDSFDNSWESSGSSGCGGDSGCSGCGGCGGD
ncbi:hypothetical protein [Flavobacterium soli]|uniref:hypothetical protein n=1 Tax=Flavobacterium soli TaxID=344881 RepID=UPI0003F6B4E0|nr:hypothetical protein [Flavobacterium soli]